MIVNDDRFQAHNIQYPTQLARHITVLLETACCYKVSHFKLPPPPV